jgi:hypothetical protein
MMSMKFAAAKAAITPQQPVFQAGFGARTRKSEGVRDDVYAKVAVLVDNMPLVFVTLDVLGGERGFAEAVYGALAAKYGLRPEQIVINYSHTHASVHISGEVKDPYRYPYSIAQDDWVIDRELTDRTADVRYSRFVTETVVRLTDDCFSTLREGTVEIASGRSDIAISRRLMTETGLKSFTPNPKAEIDRDLFVIKCSDSDGRIKAVLFQMACHPTSMGSDNYHISAEFVGHACRLLEAAYPGAVALFLQGCAAELKPAKSAENGKFFSCTYEQMRQIGADLAGVVTALLERGSFSRIEGPFRACRFDVPLDCQTADLAALERSLQASPNKFYRLVLERLIRMIRNGEAHQRVPLAVSIWHWGDRIRLVAIEGEVSTGYSLAVKKLLPDRTSIVLGYSHGQIFYIPTRAMIAEGGYEVEAYQFYGLRGPFAPEIEERLVTAIAEHDAALARSV